jgi:hypothetical protein
MATDRTTPSSEPSSAPRRPADYPPGELYLFYDPTPLRAGDVMVMVNEELETPDPQTGLRVRSRIVARFHRFFATEEESSNVAPIYAAMFTTMANDGDAAFRRFSGTEVAPLVDVVNPADGLILLVDALQVEREAAARSHQSNTRIIRPGDGS